MGFLPNVFALNMSMQRHPETHTHTHTCTHILMFAHTQDLWINSQALVWQGITGNVRQRPLPACQTWGSRSVLLVLFGDFYFICQSQLMLLYKKKFDKINVLFWIFTLIMVTSECTWWDVGRACTSEKKRKKMSVDMMSQGFCLKRKLPQCKAEVKYVFYKLFLFAPW